jgi:tetratricopeptide (TPR) repeat protein
LTAVARTAGFTVVGQLPPSHLSRKQEEVTNFLNGNKSLIIVDDFPPEFSSDAVAWLANLGETTRVLVLTGPGGKTHYPKASIIPVNGLSESEALMLFKGQATALGINQYVDRIPQSELCELYRLSEGNPQIIEQSLGLIAGAQMSLDQVIKALKTTARGPDGRSAILLDQCWKSLSEKARDILCVVPLFAKTNQVHFSALQRAAGIEDDGKFDAALNELTQFKLLEGDDVNRRYSILPTVYEFARRHLDTLLKRQPHFERDVRYRIGDFYLDFIRNNILREKPRPRYWNALVTNSAQAIDSEWPNVKPAMEWLTKRRPEVFTEFVFLIVHYLDSRSLNTERIEYVRNVIEILTIRSDRTADLALLKVDALGWTYIEEGELAKAEAEITAGLDLAETIASPEREDLIALGHAWRSRLRMEQKDEFKVDTDKERASEEAHECIATAFGVHSSSSWILARVHMAAGDLAFKEGDYNHALQQYENSVEEEDNYGGEGLHYQLAPRTGFAHLALALHDASKHNSEGAKFHLRKAHDQFSDLAAPEHITMGRLYGQYGLALVAFVEKNSEDAKNIVLSAREDVNRRISSNILKRMTDKLFEDIEKRSTAK